MTGAGTQADPYIVATLSDFFAMDDSTAYYKLGADIDFMGYEFTGTVTLMFLELDGDGHSVTNIYYPTGTAFMTGSNTNTFSNINFNNINVNVLFSKTSDASTFNNCTFAVIVGDKLYNGGATHTYHNCSISIKTINGDRLLDDANISNCNLYIDAVYTNISQYSARNVVKDYGTATNVTIRGKIVGNPNDDIQYNLLGPGTGNGVACNVELVDISQFFLASKASTTTCTINSTLAGDTTITLMRNQHAITDEQAKSAGYLNSIGFTCYEGD